jgi:murein DD-endopeptidase MepM/ murein hydrolase activator NlpD
MRQHILTLAFTLLLVASFQGWAQEWDVPDQGNAIDLVEEQGPDRPCITPEEDAALEKRLKENYRLLGLDEKATNTLTTTFYWPLRQANGLNDCSYFTIRNYVDQDPAVDSIRDWNCGKRTYDGHRGVDISPYPYSFYKMDHNQVEVVAAAPGTIVDKADGEFDRNCVWVTGTPANYVVIRHADGSTARYWHMKKNSVTAKNIGQTVETGEYLGIVGSSGFSTGPHLHFEVRKTLSVADFVDPFGGACNPQNDSTLWVNQLAYTDPTLMKVSVNPVSPVFPECPETETPNEDSCYLGGTQAKFYIFVRDQRDATTAAMRILRPDGSVFGSWTRTFTSNATRSWWGWTRTLPTETGTYLFEAAYNGEICSLPFKINCNLTDIQRHASDGLRVFSPNPISGHAAIRFEPALNNADLWIFNALGCPLHRWTNFSGSSLPLHDLPLLPGIHHLQITEGLSGTRCVKLVVTD